MLERNGIFVSQMFQERRKQFLVSLLVFQVVDPDPDSGGLGVSGDGLNGASGEQELWAALF